MRRAGCRLLSWGVLALAACARALAGAEPEARGLAGLPENRWVRLPDGPANPHAPPVYDPGTDAIVALLAGGNGTAHLDAETGSWVIDLPPVPAPPGGDQPLLKPYSLRDGRPDHSNVPLLGMVARDARRGRILAGAATLFAAYDPAARAWSDLGARVELFGESYPGAPPVAWGSMCADPENDRVILFGGGAVLDFAEWDETREVTGTFGTFIYDCAANRWSRPRLGPGSLHEARDLLRPARLRLQDLLGQTGRALLLGREAESREASQAGSSAISPAISSAISRATADALELARELAALAVRIRSLGEEPELAGAAARIELAAERLDAGVRESGVTGLASQAASAVSGRIERTYRVGYDALQALLAARDGDLRSEPHPRYLAPMVYLPDRKSILLFGGTDGHQYLNDTWELDCRRGRWERRHPRTLPRPRAMHVLVYDTKLRSAVLAGGVTSPWAPPEEELREVWIYDAERSDWRLVLDDFPIRRGCSSYHAEYHPGHDAIVLLRDGGETFALKLRPGEELLAPPATEFPQPEEPEPFLPPRDDPEVLARWRSLPPNTWVAADPPDEPGERGWGMLGWHGTLECAILWGGGHSSHQANDIRLYFPGANRWVTAYPPHRIDIPPWNKACGNPGGVDWRGGPHNLHARCGVAGIGTRILLKIPCFSPYWYGPESFLRQPLRWGRTTTFELDLFSRRWRMPCPEPPAPELAMCYPSPGEGSVVAVGLSGARVYDLAADGWRSLAAAECPVSLLVGEGASQLYVERRGVVLVVGERARGPGLETGLETWALDLASGEWRDLEPEGRPPGLPTAMAYVEPDDSVYAGCFTGFLRKTPEGQEAVYSFRRNAWTLLPTRVTERVRREGQPYRPPGLRAYHSAWSKVVYSPRSGLLLNYQDGDGGLWVLRPELGR